MSQENVAHLKYPSKEKALVFRPENNSPFCYAVIGTTYPIDNYFVSIAEPEYLRIECILEGEVEVLIHNEWCRAKRGNTLVLLPGQSYVFRSGAGTQKKHWITFNAPYMQAYLDTLGVSSGIYSIPEMQFLFEQLIPYYSVEKISIHMYYEISEYIHKMVHRIAIYMENQESDMATTIRDLLHGMVYQKASLVGIAQLVHMSAANVIRIFKNKFGITPHQYLLTLKIENAKILLKETDMSVREISEKICISDEHYFSSVFKKYAGISPREYKRQSTELH